MNSNLKEENWQQALIETNLLLIGYNAWNAYLKSGRGALIGSTTFPLLHSFGETFKTHFVSRPRLTVFLNAWLATADTIILHDHHMNGHILDAVDTYNPTQDFILLLESSKNVTFFYLKNLPLTPPECYQTVCFNWSEFHPLVNHQYLSIF